MGIIAAKCTQCGANIEINEMKDIGVCPYCDMSFIIERTVNNYTINNINIISSIPKQESAQQFYKATIKEKTDKNPQPAKKPAPPITYKMYGAASNDKSYSNHRTKNINLCPKCGAKNEGDFCPICERNSNKRGKLLGFRSGKTWKKAVSITYLVLMSLGVLGNISSTNSMYDAVTLLEATLYLFTPYLFLSNFEFRNRIPLFKKHKKWASIIGMICVWVLISITCGAINPATHCQHNWAETIVTEATCTTIGETTRYCDLCDKEETITTDKMEHKFEIKEEKEQVITKVCAVCKEEIVIDKK